MTTRGGDMRHVDPERIPRTLDGDEEMVRSRVNRRRFLASGAVAAGFTLAARAGAGAGQRPIRCGFVGVGNRGSSLLREMLALRNVEVAAICDTSKTNGDRAGDAVEKAGGKRPALLSEWGKLLVREDIPVIISALPCDLHYPMYRDALAAGKHLYGEKPMCLTAEHADRLVRQSRNTGTVFQIGYQRRFSRVYQESVKRFQQGIIGQPFDGRGARFSSGGPYRKPGEWISLRARSGDWMLEQAVHHWDGLNWALRELPVSACGTGHHDLFKDHDPMRDMSDYYTATMTYRSGLVFTWTHSHASAPHRHFRGMYERLIGPKGGIDLSEGLIALHEPGPGGKRTIQLESPTRENITRLALTSFLDCVRTGQRPVVGVEEGRDATFFGLLVQKAVYDKRVVTLDEACKAHA